MRRLDDDVAGDMIAGAIAALVRPARRGDVARIEIDHGATGYRVVGVLRTGGEIVLSSGLTPYSAREIALDQAEQHGCGLVVRPAARTCTRRWGKGP